MLDQVRLNLRELLLRKPEPSRWNHTLDLLRVASADDRRSHRGMMQRPRNRDDTRAHSMTLPNLADEVRHSKVPRQQRLLVVLGIAAEVVLGKVRHAFL